MSGDAVRPGIDTRVALALHAVGVRSFGAGRVASFPQPATGFSFEDLRFWPADEAEDGTRAESFARLLNSRVGSPLGTPQPRMLWDVYHDVLDAAQVQVADRQPSTDEQTRYDQARALLTPQVLSTYFSCKQALGNALLDLATTRARRPADDDPALGVWQVEMDAAQTRVEQAEVALELTGRSGEVQAALAVVQAWSAASSTVAWQEHRTALGSAEVSSLDGTSTYCLTRFVPTDVLDGRGWNAFSVPGTAIAGLLGGLPAGLAGIGGDPGVDSSIAELRVELTAVEVLRTWFDPGVLRSPAWRYCDGGRPPVSDGAEPATGDFPYVVTGLVLARNLTLVPAHSAGSGQPHPPLRIGYLSRGIELDPRIVRNEPAHVLRPVHPDEPDPVGPEILRTRTRVIDDGIAVAALAITDRTPVLPGPGRPRVGDLSIETKRWFREVDFVSPPVTTPATPAPAAATTLVGADEAVVIAYLLEPMGPAPHPDPGLSWA